MRLVIVKLLNSYKCDDVMVSERSNTSVNCAKSIRKNCVQLPFNCQPHRVWRHSSSPLWLLGVGPSCPKSLNLFIAGQTSLWPCRVGSGRHVPVCKWTTPGTGYLFSIRCCCHVLPLHEICSSFHLCPLYNNSHGPRRGRWQVQRAVKMLDRMFHWCLH